MKALVKILSVIVAVGLLGGHLMEFHHHDCSGGIFFALSATDELSLDDGVGECDHHCCHRSHDCESEDCPMRISGMTDLMSDGDYRHADCPVSFMSVACLFDYDLSLTENRLEPVKRLKKAVPVREGFIGLNYRRGPPPYA